MGDQFTTWLQSHHASAYTSLATPEARQIAKWSGITEEPQKSVYCLGCHATGAEAEPWERDPSFSVKDGVQCEKCHGPGSEYADAPTMMNRAAAVRAGLNIPTKEYCLNCHIEKGSHRIVMGPVNFDVEEAWKRIAHPSPENWQLERRSPVVATATAAEGPRYTGVAACAECHAGAEYGFQFSKWRDSKHANAYAVLGTSRAQELAAQAGIQGDPRREATCLKCHATAHHAPAGTLENYADYEGVGCEACHGAGSEHADEASARTDASAPLQHKLPKATNETCQSCHANAHGKPFEYESALAAIAHPKIPPATSPEPQYKTPLNLALSPDGRKLYVTCEAASSLAVIDVALGRKTAEIAVGGQPIDVALTADGKRAFVSSRLGDSVSVIDTASHQVVATLPVGDEPHGLLVDSARYLLYVLNTSSDTITVVDTNTLQPVKRLAAGHSPWDLAMSPDGSRIYVTNMYSNFVPLNSSSVSEVTVIDAERAVPDQRPMVHGANLIQGVAVHPRGQFALVTLLRTKNRVPMTRVAQGWTITNGLGVIWSDGRVDQVLLDQPGLCFPDPAAIAITPDGRLALITSSSTDRVAVVDVEKLLALLAGATPEERAKIIPNHLGKSSEFVAGYISTGISPRGLLITPDGRTAYVANALEDSLSVIDIADRKVTGRIDLGGPTEITQVRFGERLFNSANITFRRQFSCHSCHPDGHIDKITYDTEPDGIGVDPVDNKTLRGILDTAPFKWNGKNPNFSRQCGARLSSFFTRIQPFTPEELAALDRFICTIPRPPNYFRRLGAELTDAQSRGRSIFTRITTNDGREIPQNQRCTTCHFPPLYTDRRLHDVGTKMANDTSGLFDTPHLTNIYDSAPYLHNGIAPKLEEIWTRYNPKDTHGITNDMTKDQLNDLIEYLKTL
jgi:YVTN family beta-propeller protein